MPPIEYITHRHIFYAIILNNNKGAIFNGSTKGISSIKT